MWPAKLVRDARIRLPFCRARAIPIIHRRIMSLTDGGVSVSQWCVRCLSTTSLRHPNTELLRAERKCLGLLVNPEHIGNRPPQPRPRSKRNLEQVEESLRTGQKRFGIHGGISSFAWPVIAGKERICTDHPIVPRIKYWTLIRSDAPLL